MEMKKHIEDRPTIKAGKTELTVCEYDSGYSLLRVVSEENRWRVRWSIITPEGITFPESTSKEGLACEVVIDGETFSGHSPADMFRKVVKGRSREKGVQMALRALEGAEIGATEQQRHWLSEAKRKVMELLDY